jgi:hypothetical protein
MSARITHTPNAWTFDEIETLKELRTVKGWTAGAIAQILPGRTERGVGTKIRALGLTLPDGRRSGHFNRRDYNRDTILREAFAAGNGIKQTAKALSIATKSVRAAFVDYGNEYTVLHPDLPPMGGYIGAREMAAIIAPICGVPPRAIFSTTRFKPAVVARMAIARALRDRGLTLPVIARAIARKDHTTVLWLLRNFDRYQQTYPALAKAYAAIKDAEARAQDWRAAA